MFSFRQTLSPKWKAPFYIPSFNTLKLLVVPQPPQHLVWSVSLIIAIPVAVQWYFIVVSICIFMMTNSIAHFPFVYWPLVYLLL